MAETSSSYRICRLKASVKRDFAVCTNLLQVILDVKKPHQVNISERNFVTRQRQRQRIPLLTIIPQFRSTHARYIHTHVDLSPWSYAQKISPQADDVRCQWQTSRHYTRAINDDSAYTAKTAFWYVDKHDRTVYNISNHAGNKCIHSWNQSWWNRNTRTKKLRQSSINSTQMTSLPRMT